LKEAIENYDGLIVCGAGNSGWDIDGTNTYPAVSDEYNVITVGSIDSSFNKAESSSYGATTVDLFAPGHQIISCQAGTTNGYVYKNGTSMAAPHVTGVAALLLSAYPNMTPADIKETIMENVNKVMGNDPEDPDTYDQYLLEGMCVTEGVLNAKAALRNPVYHSHQYSDTYIIHRKECVCGDIYNEPHYYITPYDYGNLSNHKLLCACGHDNGTTAPHTWTLADESMYVSASPDYLAPIYVCTGCGATAINPPSGY